MVAWSLLDAETTVAAFLAAFPEASRLFLRWRMHCVGCAMAHFDTLAVAAATYGIPWEVFLKGLAPLIAEEKSREEASNSEQDATPQG
ncbi:MAG: hypothetical protein ACUVRE_10135 [Thermoanaerobaculaceae bacterium]